MYEFCQRMVRSPSSILTQLQPYCTSMTMVQRLTKRLQEDWLKIAELVVKKRGKRLQDLAFAKRTADGYAFFEEIEHSIFDTLSEITERLSYLYPEYAYALVADVSSELANSYSS